MFLYLGPFTSFPTRRTSVQFSTTRVRHHLYANDKQANEDVQVHDVSRARRTLQECVRDIANWCSSRRLQLNASKTELIWFDTRHSLKKVSGDDVLTLQIDWCRSPVSVVRDLGVMLDNELTMKQHLTKVASCCFYHLRRLKDQTTSWQRCHSTARLNNIHPSVRRRL